MITRRKLLLVFGTSALASPRAVLAQAKPAPVLIGWLNSGSRGSNGHLFEAFKEGLVALGWKEGSQFVIEERWADGRSARYQPLAKELAAKGPAVIVAAPVPVAVAAAEAAPRTPIVHIGGDPAATGLVASLARPGGMVTGLTNFSTTISGKYLELLLSAAPKLQRIGFLLDTTSMNHAVHMANARRSVAQHSVEARYEAAARPEEFEAALSRLAKAAVQALVVMPGQAAGSERRRIVGLILARRWPAIAYQREWADEGALLSYGVDYSANYRRAAVFVDKILKGARPGDLPIEQPTKFELVVNLKTAKALGITMPQSILMRADKVIE